MEFPVSPSSESSKSSNTPFGGSDPAESLDPLGFGEAWLKTANEIMRNPEGAIHAGMRYMEGMTEAFNAAASRMMGDETPPAIAAGTIVTDTGASPGRTPVRNSTPKMITVAM